LVSFMDLRKCLKYNMACWVSRIHDLGSQCIILAYLVVCHESKENREKESEIGCVLKTAND